ncbi:DUF962 domain-containing protein [Pleionea sediminis]|uniref:DUF962 domain-containing protein n=1 Tax=Pleionea sediminis TaxID=2569479 RepID=UPI0011872A30|nr:DUF962 domain-containing protein [Pleionea sediminis]
MSNQPVRIKTYDEFWLFYLREHQRSACRALHYLGTTLALATLSLFIAYQLWGWLWLPLILGYTPAWIGHFFIEKNRPATFTYPWWSFISDFKMLFYAITGKLNNELNKATKN